MNDISLDDLIKKDKDSSKMQFLKNVLTHLHRSSLKESSILKEMSREMRAEEIRISIVKKTRDLLKTNSSKRNSIKTEEDREKTEKNQKENSSPNIKVIMKLNKKIFILEL